MNVNEAWNKFICSGKVEHYLEYSSLMKQQEKENADNHQGTCNKSDGYKG